MAFFIFVELVHF